MQGKLIYQTNALLNNLIIEYGKKQDVVLKNANVVRDLPAGTLLVPTDGDGDTYTPLYPYARGKTDGTSGTDIVVQSAGEATRFNPAGDGINDNWTKNLSYWDADRDLVLDAITHSDGGAMYDENKLLASVATDTLTMSAAFTADPEDNDVIFPGGCKDAVITEQAVMLLRDVTVAELEMGGIDITVECLESGKLSAENLPTYWADLISYGVIDTYGTRRLKIDRSK